MSDFSAHYMPMYQPALKTTQEQRSFTKVPTSQPVFLPPKLTGKTQSSWSQLKTWLIELLTEEGTDERPIGITALERYRLPTGQLKESLPSNPFIANMTIKTDYRFMNGKF